jgi:hypothetical protein
VRPVSRAIPSHAPLPNNAAARREKGTKLSAGLICIPAASIASPVTTASGNSCADQAVAAWKCISPKRGCVLNTGGPQSELANSVCVKARTFSRKVSISVTMRGMDANYQYLGPEGAPLESPAITVTLYKRKRSVPSAMQASCVAVGSL